MRQDVAATRIVAATAAPITFTTVDHEGEPATPSGTVTVAVVDSQGDAVTAGAVSTSGNVSTSTLPIASTANVDRLTATWSDDGTVTGSTVHDVVGGVYASTTEIRDIVGVLESVVKWDAATVKRVRNEVEYIIERVTGRAFVPRFNSARVDGTGCDSIGLPHPDLRSVVWAQYHNGSSWVDVTGSVAEIRPDNAGTARFVSGDVWPSAPLNIGYRYGMDRPPDDLKEAAAQYIKYRLASVKSGIPDRAISIQGTELGNVVLATPGLGGWTSGIPNVDAVLNGYRWKRPVLA